MSKEMGNHNKIYLTYSVYYEKFLVSDDNDEISDEIYRCWRDSGCDSNPEDEAEEYKVWAYSLAVNKERYPNLYRNAKRSLIRSEVPLIRRNVEVECEHSVNFVINCY